ncbi:MAG: endonuclease/exonuclease/phosphatase family protein [Bacteroidales bacterium]|nr:endonuclease/exonuclease/phosphatase family protein [Bacteroidales bacterium]
MNIKMKFYIGAFYMLCSLLAIGQTTNLMTYNIRYDNKNDSVNNWEDRKTGLVNQILKYEPAILGTQEGLIHQIEFINSNLSNYNYLGVGRDDGKIRGEFCAIFYDSTQFHVLESATFWLSETPDKASIGWDAALERICTYGLFRDQDSHQLMWVFNTHFDHMGVLAREKSAELILEKIREINTQNYPLILMGDFNLTSNEKPIQNIEKQLDNAMLISINQDLGPVGTFNDFTPIANEKIDYFFTKNVEVISHQHLNDLLANGKQISDHLAVLITIKREVK